MCGITGFLLDDPRPDREALSRTLTRMTTVLHHRGPDDSGVWTDGLCGLGHTFRGRSDTEVIIEGYRAWGIDVVRRLRGMFAIALWDAGRRRLFLIRDRVGKKPLVYARRNGTVLFGSEIKALLCWPGV